MKDSNTLIAKVKDYMLTNLCEYYPELDLDTIDHSIYYMNANDGTDFDWEMNDRTCEFFLWYKSTELGVMKVYLCKDGFLEGYLWKDKGRAKGIELPRENFTDYPEDFEVDLLYTYDFQRKWDSVVGSID